MPAANPSMNIGAIPQFAIRVNGTALTPEQSGDLIEAVVDMSFGGPDMITLRFADFELKVLENTALFALGNMVEIGLGYEESPAIISKGEIVSIEPYLSGGHYFITTVRALNKMNRLSRGRKTRTFTNQKDSEIAAAVGGACGLSVVADATTAQHEYVVQWNQTDMEFLQERARRNGYTVWSDDTNLYFKQDKNVGEAVVTLRFGESLLGFRPRISLAQQVSKVVVRSWDGKAKTLITGEGATSEDLDQGGTGSLGNAQVNSVMGETPYTVIDHALKDQSEAETIAKGILTEFNRNFIEGEVDMQGTTLVTPGKLITIENVGATFSGNYFVTSVQHRLFEGNFLTSASISSSNGARVGRLLNGAREPARVEGVVPAIVTSLTDPDAMNRVQVEFPWMPQNNGSNLQSFWVRIATPFAGNSRGMLFMPEVGDEVLVAFEGGDPTRGYLLGGLYNNTDKPKYPGDATAQNGAVLKRTIFTTSGHELTFSDEAGKESITLKDKSGNTMLMDAANQLIKFTAVKDMVFDIAGDLSIKTTGKTLLESTGTFDIKATGAATINGTQSITVKANTGLTLQSQTSAELKANASLSLSSAGMAELKGSLVKIN